MRGLDPRIHPACKDSFRRRWMAGATARVFSFPPACLNFRRGKIMQAGTFFAIRAFDSGRHQEAAMRFSMNSYLLGVGPVVGALALGFGGGILLTKPAIKDSPAGP